MPGTQLRNHLIVTHGRNTQKLVAEFKATHQRLVAYLETLAFKSVLTEKEIESQWSLLTPLEQSVAEKGIRALEYVIKEFELLANNWDELVLNFAHRYAVEDYIGDMSNV